MATVSRGASEKPCSESELGEEPEFLECGLCFENDELKRLPCNPDHIYCITCLTKDAEVTKIIKCPRCRFVTIWCNLRKSKYVFLFSRITQTSLSILRFLIQKTITSDTCFVVVLRTSGLPYWIDLSVCLIYPPSKARLGGPLISTVSDESFGLLNSQVNLRK